MTKILDDVFKVKKLDSKNLLGSLELLSEQVKQVIEVAEKMKIPAEYKKVQNVVVLGMGGSALGTHILKTVFKDELKVPVEIINDYHLPKYVNDKTLVFCSSYSGTTEEVLLGMEEAKKKRAKMIGVSSGGGLTDWFKAKKLPILIFPVDKNPCGSPRMGLGYMIVGQLIIFSKVGLIKVNSEQIGEMLATIDKCQKYFGLFNKTENNIAKLTAESALDKIIIYVGAEHLLGNVHAATNQMNENAKRFANYFPIPELNHHLMEGMLFPKNNSKNLIFVLIESKLYSEKIQKRFEITKKVLEKNNIKYLSYHCEEQTKLNQVCEILVFGSYFSFYSAILEGIDPTAIPFVDFFKEQLKNK